MTEAPEQEPSFWPAIIAALLLAASTRFYNINDRALNMDEVYEVSHCAGSVLEIAQNVDGMPPTFHVLIGTAIDLFDTDLAARWVAASFGVLTTLVIGLWGRALGGARVGGYAALLAAFAPMQVLHGQHARVYSMFALTVCCALYCGWRVFRRDRWSDWLLFCAASWLAAATHYYAVLPVAMMWLLVWCSKPACIWPRGFVSAVALAIALLPVAYCVQIDMQFPDVPFAKTLFYAEDWAYTYYCLLGGYTLGPSINELRSIPLSAGIAKMLPSSIAIAVCVLPIVLAAFRSTERRTDLLRLLIFLLGAVPILGLATYWATTGYAYRYVIWLVGPMSLALAIGLSSMRSNFRLWPLAGLLAIGLYANFNWYFDDRYRQDDFHAVASFLKEQAADQPVLTYPLYFGDATTYHLADQFTVERCTLVLGGQQNWQEALPRFFEQHAGQSHYWIVAEWFAYDDLRVPTDEAFLAHLQAEPVEQITNVRIYRAPTDRLREVVQNLDALPTTE